MTSKIDEKSTEKRDISLTPGVKEKRGTFITPARSDKTSRRVKVCPTDHDQMKFNPYFLDYHSLHIVTYTVHTLSLTSLHHRRSTPELKRLKSVCNTAQKRYKARSDPNNWKNLQNAISEYKDLYNREEKRWLDKASSDLDSTDPKFWKKLHELTKGRQAYTVIQPLKDSNGEYRFDDADIARMLEECHVFKTNADTSNFDQNWFDQVSDAVPGYIQEETMNLTSVASEHYNGDIRYSEVVNALRQVKAGSAPGPDGILPCFLKHGGKSLPALLTNVFQLLWAEGCVPKVYKRDNRVYIPKPGKPNYHTEKSYRSLSLNAIIGKVFERIVTLRFIWYIETTYNIDLNQFAYLKSRNTAQALLSLVQQVKLGFREDKSTVAALVDLEGAFDGVWRQGLLHQLFNSGIKGRMFLYVASFLNERQSRSLVNGIETEWKNTTIGVPQGSVVAPLLFIFYVRHMTTTLVHNVKYADDLTGWVTHINANEAARELQEQLEGLQTWCNKWRLTINTTKTVIMCFNRKKHTDVVVKLNGQTLKQVQNSMVVGVTLDEQLTFIPHLERQADRAMSMLNTLTALSFRANGLRHKVGFHLYRSLILPYLEYCAAVWCTASASKVNRILESVQRQSLLRFSGCLNSTPVESLEVLAGFLPIRLRIQEVASHEYIRILRKPDDHPLRKLFNPDVPVSTSSISTPSDVLKSYVHCLTKRSIDVAKVEKEHICDPQEVVCIRKETLAWSDLGNSRTRTSDQIKRAQTITKEYISGLDQNSIIAYTDGSALTNPGPCGAGAAIYLEGHSSTPLEIHRPISLKSTSYHGEIQAIDLALDYIVDYLGTTSPPRSIHLLTDCQAALTSVTSPNLAGYRSHTQKISDVSSKVKNLESHGHTTSITWIAGHAGLVGNDLADKCAKKAAVEASKWDVNRDVCNKTMDEIKAEIRRKTVQAWDKAWSMCDKGRFLFDLQPKVSLKPRITKSSRGLASKYIRLCTGHTCLNEHGILQII